MLVGDVPLPLARVDPAVCVDHAEQEVALFCATCKTTICTACTTAEGGGKHATHAIQSLDEALPATAAAMDAALAAVPVALDAVMASVAQIDAQLRAGSDTHAAQLAGVSC